MKHNHWVETEREFEFDAAGNQVPRKVKYVQAHFTPDRKELVDFYLRLIGSFSILVPLLLLYFQRSNEIDKENRLALTSVYTNFTKDVAIWNDAWKDSANTIAQIDSVYSAYVPKMNLYGNNALTKAFTGLYQSAYIRSEIHWLNLYAARVIDSVDAFYTMMDLPEKDTTYQIESDDFEDDSSALFFTLNQLDLANLHLSQLRAGITVFLSNEEERSSFDTLQQDSVLLALDSLEERLYALSSVPITSLESYQQIKSSGVDTFAFTIKEISIPYRDKIYKCYANLIEQSRKNDNAYLKEVKQFQKKLLAYIR